MLRNNKVTKNIIPASIIFAGILISAAIYFKTGIDFLQKIFSIIGSLSLGVAIITYFYKKKQEETLVAIEQITFFREKVISKWDEVQKKIKDKDQKYWFSRIQLDKQTTEGIRKDFSRNFDNQLSIFLDTSKADPVAWLDGSILDQQVFLLNILEEFSLKVDHFNTQQHPALDSVHNAFIEIMEKNAVALIFMRDVATGNPIYSTTLALYSSWKKTITRSNYLKNLEKHGFITKEKMQEIFKEQRKNTSKS